MTLPSVDGKVMLASTQDGTLYGQELSHVLFTCVGYLILTMPFPSRCYHLCMLIRDIEEISD